MFINNAVQPLKIFISYGREIGIKDESTQTLVFPEPNNESFARKLADFFKKRGHSVWFDQDEIKPLERFWK